MISIETPWNNIPSPKGSMTATLRVKDSVNNWYWIRCENGKFGIAIQIPINDSEEIHSIQETSRLSIIHIKDIATAYLGVVTNSSELATVFYQLCLDLISSCQFSKSSSEIITILKRRVASWQRLLEKGRNKLTPERCLGLISELKFLREHWIPKISTNGVIGWQGPNGAYQDFQDSTLNLSIEVKTHPFDSNTVKISSREQLDIDGILFLVTYPAAISLEKTEITLNSYIEETRKMIPVDQYMIFDERLLSLGYVKDESYEDLSFCIGEAKVYSVKSNFPRVTSETLPFGISKIRYEIDLSYASEWVCSIDEINREIRNE